MLLSPRKNGLASLFKEVRVVKAPFSLPKGPSHTVALRDGPMRPGDRFSKRGSFPAPKPCQLAGLGLFGSVFLAIK